jgi:uncharacterized integral membrane protein
LKGSDGCQTRRTDGLTCGADRCGEGVLLAGLPEPGLCTGCRSLRLFRVPRGSRYLVAWSSIDSTVAEQGAVSFSPYLGPRLLLRILLAVAGIGRGRAQANRAEVRADLLERFSLPIGLGAVGLALVGTLFGLRPGTGRCGNRLFACLPSFVTASSLSRCSLWTLWLLFFSLRSIAPVFTTTGNAPGK